MRNVTLSLDDALALLTEAEAEKAGKTLSDFVSSILAEKIESADAAKQRRINQMEAVKRLREGPLLPLSENGRMPNSDERNARR